MELFWNLSKHMISTQKIIQVGVLCLFGVPFFLQKTNKTMRTPAHVLSCSVERRSWTVAVLHWCCAVRFPRDNPSERPGDLPEQEQQRQISEEISFFFFLGSSFVSVGVVAWRHPRTFPIKTEPTQLAIFLETSWGDYHLFSCCISDSKKKG